MASAVCGDRARSGDLADHHLNNSSPLRCWRSSECSLQTLRIERSSLSDKILPTTCNIIGSFFGLLVGACSSSWELLGLIILLFFSCQSLIFFLILVWWGELIRVWFLGLWWAGLRRGCSQGWWDWELMEWLFLLTAIGFLGWSRSSCRGNILGKFRWTAKRCS